MPLVSIIMPAFNAEKTLLASVESVLNQTLTDWELLITDDGSTDNTKNIILELAANDRRIKYFKNKGRRGAWSARNNSLSEATGDYIAFLDSDDNWLPEKLQQQVTIMGAMGVNASHCTYNRINKHGVVLGQVKAKKYVQFKDMLKKNEIGNLTGVYNAKELGKFYQSPIGHEDYAMWLEIIQETDSVGIQEPMANYLVADNSLSSNKLKAATWHFKILRKQKSITLFNIWYYFFCYCLNAIKSRA